MEGSFCLFERQFGQMNHSSEDALLSIACWIITTVRTVQTAPKVDETWSCSMFIYESLPYSQL